MTTYETTFRLDGTGTSPVFNIVKNGHIKQVFLGTSIGLGEIIRGVVYLTSGSSTTIIAKKIMGPKDGSLEYWCDIPVRAGDSIYVSINRAYNSNVYTLRVIVDD